MFCYFFHQLRCSFVPCLRFPVLRKTTIFCPKKFSATKITVPRYNLIHLNYWLSTGISYFIGGVFSYHANGKVTFKVENKDKWLPYRFAANLIVCYLIAFGVAKPLVIRILAAQPAVIVDNAAMALGTVIFVALNFFGQKIVVSP